MSPRLIKNKNIRQRKIRQWHRWVGYSSLLLIFILSITGLILNRTEMFNLNQITIKNGIISALYGISPKENPHHFKEANIWVSWLEGRLYLNGIMIDKNTSRPVGITILNDLVIVGEKDSLSLFLNDGSLVEKIDKASLPDSIVAIGKTTDNMIWIHTAQGNFISDDNFLIWKKTSKKFEIPSPPPQFAPKEITEKILSDFQGKGISLYRLILDLHSGHIFGSFGSYIMDLAAISLIVLGITGLMKQRPRDKKQR
ncbi:MAG: PepSY domain-containing protein [Emcibacter sp.]|nr:PepSY domain-containing protein [Emcibacter sp.]